MTEWSVWEPESGRMDEVDGLATALCGLSTGFGNAKMQANSAAGTAEWMTPTSVQTWVSLVRGFGRDAAAATQSVASLSTVLTTYANAVADIKKKAQAQRDRIGNWGVRSTVASRLRGQSVSWWAIDSIATDVSRAYDPPPDPPTTTGVGQCTAPSGPYYWLVRDVAGELSKLAQKRADADATVITDIQRAVPTTSVLFGVTPHLSGDKPGWSWSVSDGAFGLGTAFKWLGANLKGQQFALGAYKAPDKPWLGIKFKDGGSPQWAKGFGIAGGALGAAAGAFGTAQGISQIVAWAHGEDVSLGQAVGTTVSGAAGLAGGVASIAKAAGAIVPKGLIPGLGLVASIPGVISSGSNMVQAWQSGSTVDKVGTTMSFVGNVVSMFGSVVPPPPGLIVSGVGALLSGAGSLISRFWPR